MSTREISRTAVHTITRDIVFDEAILPTWAVDFRLGTGGMTFSRASGACMFTSSGLLTTVASDTPRLDYHPATLAPRGLLVEEQRTNLFQYSNDFTNAAWVKNSTAISAAAGTGLDGTSSASKLTATSTGTHFMAQAQAATSGTTYTFSAYMKKAEHDWVQMTLSSTLVSPTVWVNFNLANGTIGNGSAGVLATITPAANGFYRCTLTGTATASATDNLGVLFLTNNSNSATRGPSYTPGAGGILVTGAQVEAGAFATSYIPTTTAAVTRAADSCSIGSLVANIGFQPAAGTLLVEWVAGQAAQAGVLARLHNTDADAIALNQATATPASMLNRAGGTSSVNAALGSGAPVAGTLYKAAYAFTTNDFAGCVNNGTPATAASGSLPTVNTLNVGRRDSDSFLNGWIRKVAYFSQRLSNAQIAALTA